MTIEELKQIAENVRQENAKYDFEVNVCMDLACASQGAQQLTDALVKAVEKAGKKVFVRNDVACYRAACEMLGPARTGRWSAWIPTIRFTSMFIPSTPRPSPTAWAASPFPNCNAT